MIPSETGSGGSLFDGPAGGWLAGKEEFVPQIKDCIRGNAWWCPQPDQAVNFVSCHDNLTLWGKLAQVFSDQSQEFLRAANRLAAATVFFSQGMPFLLGGEELFLAKEDGNGGYDPNSYNVTDGRNRIPWSRLSQPEVRENRDYYRRLIEFRKAHPLLRLRSKEQVDAALSFLDTQGCLIAFTNTRSSVDGGARELMIAFNPGLEPVELALEGNWQTLLQQGLVQPQNKREHCGSREWDFWQQNSANGKNHMFSSGHCGKIKRYLTFSNKYLTFLGCVLLGISVTIKDNHRQLPGGMQDEKSGEPRQPKALPGKGQFLDPHSGIGQRHRDSLSGKNFKRQSPGAEKSHAIENFRIAAGESKGEFYGTVFQDSDVAKWLEAVCLFAGEKAGC